MCYPQASPYPLTSTLLSSHSTRDLSAGTRKVDSGFSEQHGTVTMSGNFGSGSAGRNSIIRETTDSHLFSQHSDGLKHSHQNGMTLVRLNSSNLSSSSNKAGSETVSILRRPHSAGAVLGHIGQCWVLLFSQRHGAAQKEEEMQSQGQRSSP